MILIVYVLSIQAEVHLLEQQNVLEVERDVLVMYSVENTQLQMGSHYAHKSCTVWLQAN